MLQAPRRRVSAGDVLGFTRGPGPKRLVPLLRALATLGDGAEVGATLSRPGWDVPGHQAVTRPSFWVRRSPVPVRAHAGKAPCRRRSVSRLLQCGARVSKENMNEFECVGELGWIWTNEWI